MFKFYKPDNKPFESLEQAEEYIREDVHDIFEVDKWRQGEYEDSIVVTVQVQDKYYNANVEVETIGERQDRGDKIYNIDKVINITFTETTQGQLESTIDTYYELKRRRLQAELTTLKESKRKTWLTYGFPEKQPNQEVDRYKQELITELIEHRWDNVDIE